MVLLHPDAVVDPGTVVVVDPHTPVADITVLGPQRLDDLAVGTDQRAVSPLLEQFHQCGVRPFGEVSRVLEPGAEEEKQRAEGAYRENHDPDHRLDNCKIHLI